MYSRVYYHFVSFYSSFFISFFFFFNDTATTEIYTLSLHDALPILFKRSQEQVGYRIVEQAAAHARQIGVAVERSEEHTSELQSLAYLVCRLLLEKKKKKKHNNINTKSKKHPT